jgi:hypothetical protein
MTLCSNSHARGCHAHSAERAALRAAHCCHRHKKTPIGSLCVRSMHQIAVACLQARCSWAGRHAALHGAMHLHFQSVHHAYAVLHGLLARQGALCGMHRGVLVLTRLLRPRQTSRHSLRHTCTTSTLKASTQHEFVAKPICMTTQIGASVHDACHGHHMTLSCSRCTPASGARLIKRCLSSTSRSCEAACRSELNVCPSESPQR